jgi:hypothetical protein
VATLRSIYASIEDGQTTAEREFELSEDGKAGLLGDAGEQPPPPERAPGEEG